MTIPTRSRIARQANRIATAMFRPEPFSSSLDALDTAARYLPPADQSSPPESGYWALGATHTLHAPHDDYLTRVSFTPYHDHPEHVRVRVINWHGECIRNGTYPVATAREFYRRLRDAGFVVGTEP